MKRLSAIIILLILIAIPGGFRRVGGEALPDDAGRRYMMLYNTMRLEGTVDYAAFEQAMRGYEKIIGRKKDILVIIDYSKPSTEERFHVLDIAKGKRLHSSLVAHGRNSGDNYATSFSNISGSHKSSLGFFMTGRSYLGGNGYSLLLEGLEKGINDKARERSIVIHGAAYCNPSVIGRAGRLGRSFGCPALPESVNKEIIDVIKEGSLIYIYANNSDYLNKSAILE
jgi:hypothetical protein